jgi:hypothetical protein
MAGTIESSQLLQLVTEPIKVGREAAYEAIESDIARACAELGCPHPHLALEPVSGSHEVWWLNSFSSDADRQRVVEEYARNSALMAVLERNSRRKADVTGPVVDLLCRYRPDLSRGARLELAGARFIVAAFNPVAAAFSGPVFQAGDGTLLLLRTARTRQDAERFVTGAAGTMLAIRPSWGLPAKDWIEADPELWSVNPAVRR